MTNTRRTTLSQSITAMVGAMLVTVLVIGTTAVPGPVAFPHVAAPIA